MRTVFGSFRSGVPGAEKAVIGCLLFLDLAFLLHLGLQMEDAVSPLAGGWSLTITARDGKLYRQWENERDDIHLPAGFLRVPPDAQTPFPMPELLIGQNRVPDIILASALAAGTKPSELPDGCVLVYDRFDVSTPGFPRVSLLSGDSREICVLLDASGTMSQPYRQGERRTVFMRALENLSLRRAEDDVPWRLFTFSDGLRDHGPWKKGEAGALTGLPEPKGRTALLSAMEGLLKTVKGPARLLVISDGVITERDRGSVERVFSVLKASGIRIHLLSPDLLPLERFGFAYGSGLALASWPEPEEKNLIRSTNARIKTAGGEAEARWSDVPETMGGAELLPVLFSKEGWPLIYVSATGGRVMHHLVGTPSFPLARIGEYLRLERGVQPVVVLEEGAVTVDIFEKDFGPMRADLGKGWVTLHVERPGVFRLALDSAIPPEIGFHHQRTGSFVLHGIDRLGAMTGGRPGKAEKKLGFRLPGGEALPGELRFAAILALLHGVAYLGLIGAYRRSMIL